MLPKRGEIFKSKEKIDADKFRELILDMYRGFPNWRYSGMVEAVVKTEEDRGQLVKYGFLTKEKIYEAKRTRDQYGLGPNALPLVNSWKIEELTTTIIILTIVMILLMLVQIFPS